MNNDTKPEASQENVAYTTEEITTICDRCTFLNRNCRQFDKDARKLQLAIDLRDSINFVNAMIDEIEPDRFKLFFGSGQLDLLPGNTKSVRVARLAPIEDPIKNGEEVTVKWKFRILVLKKEDSSQPCQDESKCEDVKNTPNKDCDDEAYHENANVMFEIPGKRWCCLLEAVKDADHENLKKCINDVNKTVQQQNNVIANLSTNVKLSSDNAETDQFMSVTKSFKSCDTVKVQLCSKVLRGILSPTIQLFQINDKMHVCLEHRNYPKQCFVKCSAQNAFQTQYDDIENYISLRKPVLMMEITTSAIKEDDTITLFNLPVTFSREEDNNLVMNFFLSQTHQRDVKVLRLDLVCIKIKIPQNKEKQVGYWVGHFDITKAVVHPKHIKKVPVEARLIQSSSPIPEFVFEKKCLITAEIIHLSTPDRNHLGALIQCKFASGLVQNICIGMEPENNIDNVLPAELSLFEMYPSLQFNQLNEYQTDAVKEALRKPFTLIQGPPGTGKTVTGVHIAYWFAQMNRRPCNYFMNPDMAPNNANESAVFYCGPSNKSVDVVARYLKKIPSVKILRMYSEEIEGMEFPIPNKVLAFRRKRLSAQLKVDEELKDVSLHHVIRSERCPFAANLQEFDQKFKKCFDDHKDASLETIEEYKKLKSDAEHWAFHDKVDIILCTCTSAFSPRIKEVFTKCQCIIDECGMCIESETLCAIIGSNAAQVVLIGDHKQLQPVIKDDKAKDLGLGISMFERYSKKAQMLKRQYRMHEKICEFPSRYFYDGKLETAKQVRDRDPDNLQLWPKGNNYPFLFHHTEGKEESLVVSTEQGNENSKRNKKEISKVAYYTRELVKSGVTQQKILVLSPYKAQCHYVKEELKKHGLADVAVMTVVASQGSEKDYVILSLVRSLPKNEIAKNPSRSWLIENLGFVTDEHQINVALTRSKRGLCIIGNSNLVRVCDVWKGLLEHYENNDCLLYDNRNYIP